LSRDASDVVAFDDIVQPLTRLIEETAAGPEARIHFVVDGDAGDLPGELATPLAVVLNELLQNAVDHAFPRQPGACVEGTVRVELAREGDDVVVDVVDDGVGLPDDFDLTTGAGLGLSIVQTLVTSEMDGEIEVRDDGGTRVRLRVPVRAQSEVRR